MAQNFEKSVKGATKVKLAAPKSKYIEHILVATHTGEAGVAEIFRTLHLRVRDSTWTIAFKSLIVIHFMIREGQLDATLQYMAENPRKIAVNGFSEVQPQGRNIRRYASYLLSRARAFEQTKTDYVRSGQGRMKRLTVEKGLLRETEVVQKQIKELLRCDLLTDEVENEITLTAFRLLTLDLLTLYSVMNEGTINVLEHYFEMSRPDSERALEIYKTFTAQTEEVVKFLGVARHFQSATRLEIPKLKHASTDLTRLLEDDLNDPDFNLRRREYLARQGKGGSSNAFAAAAAASSTENKPAGNPASTPARPKTEPSPQTKANPSSLIDFFDSIEQPAQPQQQLQQQPQAMQFQQTGFPGQQPGFFPQQQGFQPQQTGFEQQQQQQLPQQTGFGQQGPFGPFAPQNPNQFAQQQVPAPLQATPTGAGFGGYSPQPQAQVYPSHLPPIPQNNAVAFPQQQLSPNALQPQTTNPFRQSMLMSNPTGSAAASPASPVNRQSTNPFAKRLSTVNPSFNPGAPEPFPPTLQPPQPQPQPQPAPLQPQRTGTNPFARSSSVPPQQSQGLQPAAAPLRPTPTGSTNPFRQSTLVQQTGPGWPVNGQQGTMGGLEQLDTVPIFPRPGFS
ncbi:ANTH domain-containing protein [Aspergillus granulosus]|uniref:ANTH domain-containing protein n=1 Tax=Aspergillus granulosus TaxID=176169 RepID=A0ABR4HDL2_9EURO